MNTTDVLKPFLQAKRWLFSCLGVRRLGDDKIQLPKPPRPSNGKRVLIVDDDAVIRKATTLLLERHGYTVVTAEDASSAISVARREHLDCILMDVNFPPEIDAMSWDGFLIMSWLRRTESVGKVPVLMCTGENTRQSELRARADGAAGFLAKPIDFNRLVTLIDEVIEKSRVPKAQLDTQFCNS
jgi:CheY-like chemotaxis protein